MSTRDTKQFKHLKCATSELQEVLRSPTFSCPGPEGAAVIQDVVERQRDDEKGAVAGRVHLEGHVALVQPHRLTLLGHGRLKQLPRHLGAKMESVKVAEAKGPRFNT